MLIKIKVLTFFTLFAISQVCSAQLSQRTILETTILCEQLLADYAIAIDHLDEDGFDRIFTDDATFQGTDPADGEDRFRQYIRDHGKHAHFIMFTSTEITMQSETQASGIAYGVILSGDRKLSEAAGPIQMKGITAATEYYANFRLTENGWKISNMSRKGFFQGPGHGN